MSSVFHSPVWFVPFMISANPAKSHSESIRWDPDFSVQCSSSPSRPQQIWQAVLWEYQPRSIFHSSVWFVSFTTSANLASYALRVSGKIRISQSSVVCLFHDFDKSIRSSQIVPHENKILQNIWLSRIFHLHLRNSEHGQDYFFSQDNSVELLIIFNYSYLRL